MDFPNVWTTTQSRGLQITTPNFKTLQTMRRDLTNLLKAYDLERFPVIERHGGLLNSSITRGEPHFLGRVVGVGDAVSTANLLGGEGIRYALMSADLLAPLLVSAFSSTSSNSLKKLFFEYLDRVF